jgi:CubicO group peptidase (beta-lactamase class C family)
MKGTPADFPAGAGHRYTDHGHALLAAVIEVASGMSYEDYVHSALLEPAGLTNTRFESESPTSAPLAVEYADYAGSASRVGTRPYVWGRRGAMGVITTVEDLWRWHRAIEGGRILGQDARTRMLTGWTATGRPTRIGYGWEVGTSQRGTRIRHRLSAWSTNSVEVVYDEDEDLFIAFAANSPTNWARPKYLEVINAALGLEHLDRPRRYR